MEAINLKFFVFGTCFSFVLSECAFPGIPNGIDVANFKFLKYTENATAFYRCKDPNDIILTENNGNFGLKSYSTRSCSNGKWLGLLPQCGRKGEQDLFLDYLLTTDNDHSEKVIISMMYKNKTAEVLSNLDEDNCVIISSEIMSWTVKLANYTLSTYIEVELKLNEEFEDENLENLPLELNAGRYQRCVLVSLKSVPRYAYSGNQGVIRSFVTRHFNVTQPKAYFVHLVGFLCERLEHMVDSTSYATKIESYFTNTYQISTKSEIVEVQAFCDIKVLHPEPFKCGRAENPLNGKIEVHSLVSNIAPKYGDFKDILQAKITYKCNENFQLHFSDDEYTRNNGLLCGPDGRWIGEAPTCKPIANCPMGGVQNSERVTVEYEQFTYWNRTPVAYKGTIATYACKNNASHTEKLMLQGVQIVTCEQSGNWSYSEPQCLYLHEINAESGKKIKNQIVPFFSLVIYTLFAAIVGLSLIAGVASYVYVRKVRARKSKGIRRRRALPRVHFDQQQPKKDEDNYYTIYYGDLRKSAVYPDNYIVPSNRMDYMSEDDEYVDMNRKTGDYEELNGFGRSYHDDQNYIDVIENYANEFIRSGQNRPQQQQMYEEIATINRANRPRRPLPDMDAEYDDVRARDSASGNCRY